MSWTPGNYASGGAWTRLALYVRRKTSKSQAAAIPTGSILNSLLGSLQLESVGVLQVATPLTFGSMDATLDSLGVSIASNIYVTGVGANALAATSVAGVGKLKITASRTITLGALSLANTATSKITGTASGTLGALTASATSGTGLATPTLSNFSALGTAPVVLQWGTADYIAGLRGQIQIATDSGFSSITQDILFFIDGDSWARLDEAIGLTSPGGTYYARIRAVRDNEAGLTSLTDSFGSTFNADVSAWSSTFTDTITGSAASFYTTTGANKHTALTVTGTPPLSVKGTAGWGSNGEPVRSTLEQASDYAQVEVTLGSSSATFFCGFENGTANLQTGGSPGQIDSTGIAVNFWSAGSRIDINWNGSVSSTGVSNGAGSWQANDIFSLRLKKSTNTLQIWRTRSGTTTLLATKTGMPSLSHYNFYVGPTDASTYVTNFGGSTYAKVIDAGCSTVWA
jgi:hypothetical protein